MEDHTLTRSHRLIAVSVIVQHLQEAERQEGSRSAFSFLERRRLLHRQPWRRPARAAASTFSVLETVRRFEALGREH